MISVVGTMREASRIAQHLAKHVIIVVERTTLRMYANLREDQAKISHIGQRVNVLTDVIFMKLIAVMTAPRIVLKVLIWMI